MTEKTNKLVLEYPSQPLVRPWSKKAILAFCWPPLFLGYGWVCTLVLSLFCDPTGPTSYYPRVVALIVYFGVGLTLSIIAKLNINKSHMHLQGNLLAVIAIAINGIILGAIFYIVLSNYFNDTHIESYFGALHSRENSNMAAPQFS